MFFVIASHPGVQPLPEYLPPRTVGSDDRVVVDGAFKAPGLRNVEFIAPISTTADKPP